MRWQALFSDLEGQWAAAETAELEGEVSERTRRETALLALVDRLAPAVGHALAVTVHGVGTLSGRLLDVGPDWLLLEEHGAEVLVPLRAVLGVTGAGRLVGQASGVVAAGLDLRWALRGLARSRAGVAVLLVDGSQVTGTLDRVGADHVDVAEHGRGEARRPATVRSVRLVPLAAVAAVRSA